MPFLALDKLVGVLFPLKEKHKGWLAVLHIKAPDIYGLRLSQTKFGFQLQSVILSPSVFSRFSSL